MTSCSNVPLHSLAAHIHTSLWRGSAFVKYTVADLMRVVKTHTCRGTFLKNCTHESICIVCQKYKYLQGRHGVKDSMEMPIGSSGSSQVCLIFCISLHNFKSFTEPNCCMLLHWYFNKWINIIYRDCPKYIIFFPFFFLKKKFLQFHSL